MSYFNQATVGAACNVAQLESDVQQHQADAMQGIGPRIGAVRSTSASHERAARTRARAPRAGTVESGTTARS